MTDTGVGSAPDREDEEHHVDDVVRLSRENAEWVERQGTSADMEITLRRLMDEYRDTVRFLVNWTTTSETHRTIFFLIVSHESGLLLGDLQDAVDASDRTVRKRLAELQDAGMIERGGYPQVCSVADDELYVVCCEVAQLV